MPRLAAYPAFLASLLAPGLGQALAGAPARGLVMLALAGAFAAALAGGQVRLPAAGGIGPRDAWLGAAGFLLWGFAPYDAWFRAREGLNGMLPLLPRTPRVAAAADLLWGGAGALYLGLWRGLAGALGTLALALSLSSWTALALLVAWNAAWAAVSYRHAVRRYHQMPAYRSLHARLALAPLDSPLAPSPSLPLATLVAAFIAAVGGVLVQRSLADLERPVAAATLPTGLVSGQRYIDGVHGIGLELPGPAEGWRFSPGRPPALLAGPHAGRGLAFTLAVAARPLFAAGDVIPAGALERFARRHEADLAASLDGFQVAGRHPVALGPHPGLRLAFQSTSGGAPTRTLQDYVLDRDRVVILTLAGPALAPEAELAAEMDRLAAGLELAP